MPIDLAGKAGRRSPTLHQKGAISCSVRTPRAESQKKQVARTKAKRMSVLEDNSVLPKVLVSTLLRRQTKTPRLIPDGKSIPRLSCISHVAGSNTADARLANRARIPGRYTSDLDLWSPNTSPSLRSPFPLGTEQVFSTSLRQMDLL